VTHPHWATRDNRLLMFATNVASRYLVMLAVAVIGLVVLPINLKYLGKEDYGLWMLSASAATYFSILELGYGGAIVRYVAEFRARKDAQALNETLSTMFFVFSAMGALVYLLAVGASFLLPYIFNLDAEQARTGQIVFLIIAVNISLHFVFSIFGGVINGFERYYLNNVAGGVSTIVAAVVNVAVLMLGYGLVELVAATTLVRIVPYWFYRHNAYKVFPEMEISLRHFRRERLRALTGFSIYHEHRRRRCVYGCPAVGRCARQDDEPDPQLPGAGSRLAQRGWRGRGTAAAAAEGDTVPAGHLGVSLRHRRRGR
jgi:O-antigen/teichoic acid export membrane protein